MSNVVEMKKRNKGRMEEGGGKREEGRGRKEEGKKVCIYFTMLSPSPY